MITDHGVLSRLQANWVYGGSLAGLLLLVLMPVLVQGWVCGQVFTFLALPVYMLHQFEEHNDDRFRRFVNVEFGHGAEVLSVADVFWINVLGVWAVMVAILWAAFYLSPGWGAMAGWFLLINAAAHIAQAAALRRPNPGVWTALVLFLPLGLATIGTNPATISQTLIAILLVFALHAAILLRVAHHRKAARP